MPRNPFRFVWVLALAAAAAACGPPEEPELEEGSAVEGGAGRVVNLEQGWSEDDQQEFWFGAQGSYIVPYRWFLVLETAAGEERFRSDANIDRLRYLPEVPTARNPDGLPVGFVKSVDRESREWMGFTCGACHTGQVEYRGTAMRIDGGPTLADARGFLDGLVAALQATAGDDAKFARFADGVLGAGHDPGAAAELRREVEARAASLSAWVTRNATTPVAYGYARWDAFGTLLNQFMAGDLDIPENSRPADAPVSYPFLWDTHRFDRVQWNGSAFNFAIGPVARNVGEILGVFGTVEVDPGASPPGYASSADVRGLGDLEAVLARLRSPALPEEILPPIDRARAAAGEPIYREQCASCHEVIDRADGERGIEVVMVPAAEVGTDPRTADNFADRTGRSGRLEGSKEFFLAGATIGAEASGAAILNNIVIGAMVRHPIEVMGATLEDFVDVRLDADFDVRSYKARPLDGVWATAPYLHNGSVPNLWQLLQPPAERVATFHVGSREIDPVNVGLDAAAAPGTFAFDTALPGNSSAGHAYGTELTEEQKWQLIEYLKSL